MSKLVAVETDGTVFYVEVVEAGGVEPAAFVGVSSFDEVTNTIKAIAGSLSSAWEAVRPDEAVVEFGLKLTGKSGKLTGLLVEGGGEASLKITLTWKASPGKTTIAPAAR